LSDRGLAAADWFAVDEDGAGAALAFAAAVFGSGEGEFFAEDTEQGSVGSDIDTVASGVHVEFD
jgi:hypothetical protein